MKLVHIISSLEVGGAQAVLYDLVVHLKKRGHEQTIIYMHDGPYRERFQTIAIPLKQVTGIISVFDPICLLRLIILLRQLRPACVHTVLWAANWFCRLAARLLSISCVTSLHNNYDQNGTMRILLDQVMPYRSCALVAVSDEVKRSFNNAHATISNITVIPNGIDVIAISDRAHAQQKIREQLNLSPDDFVIGTVGRFHPVKRYPLLFDAFSLVHTQYPQTRLVVIGEGVQEQFLRVYAKSCNIDPFVRWVVGQPAYGYYRLFDCFVLASEKEGISIALLEAMSLGILPIVTYHNTQHPVITHGHNGYVAKSANATQFALSIGACITNNQYSTKMRQYAQQTVRERFAVRAMIAAYNRLFHVHTDIKK